MKLLIAAVMIVAVTGCTAEPTASPEPTATPTEQPPTPTPETSATTAPSASPTIEPEPSLSLAPPDARDPRVVIAAVSPDVGEVGGLLTVTVTSVTDERIDELVLRWPTELGATLMLAPFEPSPGRISDGGPPLVQEWTKWVVGPGEQGEPEGTISVGWGPLLPRATLSIPLIVTRVAAGPVAFDLQLLAGNGLLTFESGEPAELRVEVP